MIILYKGVGASYKHNTILAGKSYHNPCLNQLDYKRGLCYLSLGDQ